MKNIMIPVEVIAHFDIEGLITPYKIKYKEGNLTTLTILKMLKHDINTYAGNTVEIYECIAQAETDKIHLSLNYEKKINKWFLTKI